MIKTTFETQLDKSKPSKPRILIVDDNLELLEELDTMLTLGGYDVLALNDGTQVFDIALKNKPDLILLDLKMGPKTGFQIADEIRHSLLLKETPILAMTGFYTEKQHSLLMKICGIKTCVLKPFRPINLITKIEYALGNRFQEHDSDGT